MNHKRVLIISPYFPPSNAADMQRIRMSLPYFRDYGWEAEVVVVDPTYSEMVKDPLLLETIPKDITIHTVGAFSKKWTSKFGLGSLALRSLWFYREKVNFLLTRGQFDLIYFSTTQFPLCILGAYWKKKFRIPYVIDMQDPWHSTYYQDKPKWQRPQKYWFSYRLNKYLEPMAMNQVDGLISVSEAYIAQLKERYKNVHTIPTETITFGYFKKDFEVARRYSAMIPKVYNPRPGALNLVYVGRGGYDMQASVRLLFQAFKSLLDEHYDLFSRLKFHFIGTSYAPAGRGTKTIQPVAEDLGIADFVSEQTDRISYFENIKCLQEADALIIPGSNDAAYTASKIYPYILTEKPLLGIFNSSSSAFEIIEKSNSGTVADLNDGSSVETIQKFLVDFVGQSKKKPDTNWEYIQQYSAEALTKRQCDLFDRCLNQRASPPPVIPTSLSSRRPVISMKGEILIDFSLRSK